MTQNFMAVPKMEKWSGKPNLVGRNKNEIAREYATNKMVNILKKMHSPSNFAAPAQHLPGMISPQQLHASKSGGFKTHKV